MQRYRDIHVASADVTDVRARPVTIKTRRLRRNTFTPRSRIAGTD